MGHIYFSDDVDRAAVPSTSTAAPAAAATKFAQCCSRARVDYNMSDPCYVFKAIRNLDCSIAAASISNNSIKLYSCSASGLSHAADLQAHRDTITDVQFPLPAVSQALYSCSRDGCIKGWDLRSRQQAERYDTYRRALASPLCIEAILESSFGFLDHAQSQLTRLSIACTLLLTLRLKHAMQLQGPSNITVQQAVDRRAQQSVGCVLQACLPVV